MPAGLSVQHKAVTTGAQAQLTVPADCAYVSLQALSNNINYDLSGTDVTADQGPVIIAGQDVLEITAAQARAAKFRATGGDGTLLAQYYGNDHV